MHRQQTRMNVCICLILTLLLCQWCVKGQEVKALSCAENKCEISSAVQISSADMLQLVDQERISGREESAEVIRGMSRKTSSLYVRRELTGVSFVEHLPQIFHSTIFLQNNQVPHNTSGHIELIRCIYQKDGKKEVLA